MLVSYFHSAGSEPIFLIVQISEYVECSTYLDQQIEKKNSTLNLNRLFYRSELTEKINNLAMETKNTVSKIEVVPFGEYLGY